MVPAIRKRFNESFTAEKYQQFLTDLHNIHPGAIEFRVAETPVFIPKEFAAKVIDACESITDIITDPRFKELTKNAIPKDLQVPNENDYPDFIAFDFGICINDDGEYEPMLIEMQGFPTLFAYEVLLDDVFRKHFEIPGDYSAYLGGHSRETYLESFKQIVLGDHAPENVVLLEIFPKKQKTRVDFYCTEEYLGIKMVCLTEIIKEGKILYYINNGARTPIKRIYNRVIFDELQQQPMEVQEQGKILFEDLDVEWAPHPNWFYRISKYTLPFIKHPYVPTTFFLNEIKQIPADLENYVLKPLFSFAGQGVVIDVTSKDIEDVKDPQNWILQKKVKYAEVIQTPGELAKSEIRIFYFWKKGDARPTPANNLARLSKGKMIGVRYNKDKDWVGGSYCVFEK
jgi:hypothetical protein